MRVKLILENDIRIKKRKCCYLVDEKICAKVSDVSCLIKKRFFTSDGKVALFMDGFLILPEEDIKIIQDNDVISVRFSPETKNTEIAVSGKCPERKYVAPPLSESDTSSLDSEDNKVNKVAVNNNKKLNSSKELTHNTIKAEIPLKKSVIKKSKSSNKPVDVLTKVASSVKNSPIKGIIMLRKAAPVSTQASANKNVVPRKVISKPVNKNTIPLTKVGVKKEIDSVDSTSSSSTSSSSSNEEDTLTVRKKITVTNSVEQPKIKQTFSKQPYTMKTNEGIYTKIKTVSPLIINNSKGAENGKSVKHSANSIATIQSSSGNDSSSSDSTDSTGDMKKNTVNVDFRVSKLLKNKNLTNISSLRCTDDFINNKPGYVGNCNANEYLADDWNESSQFNVSKPITMDLGTSGNDAKKLIDRSLNIKDAIGDNCNLEDFVVNTSNNSVFVHSNTFNLSNNCTSRKTARNRRRRQTRKENMRIRQLSIKKDKVSVKSNETLLGNKESKYDDLKGDDATFDVFTNGSSCIM